MRTFTDSPYERTMMQVPHRPRPSRPAPAPKGHPCHGCKRFGEGCVLPCGNVKEFSQNGLQALA